MTTASTLLRQARSAAGLSTRDLARAAGSAQPRVTEIERGSSNPRIDTLEGLLRAAGFQLVILPTRAPTAASVAQSIHDDLANREADADDRAFRSLLVLSDGLATAAEPIKVALAATPPRLTGDPRFDAAIAGIVEHHLSPAGLPVPDWVLEPARSLTESWTPDPHAADDIAADTPAALRRHGVLLATSELASI